MIMLIKIGSTYSGIMLTMMIILLEKRPVLQNNFPDLVNMVLETTWYTSNFQFYH